MYSEELKELGLVIFRQENATGGVKPHVSVRFKPKGGNLLTFAIDTTRTPAKSKTQPDAYLITHAHSDHYGKSAMLSEKSWCSKETAKALEIRYEKEYKGHVFELGETVNIGGAEVQTIDVGHTPGSTAFFWENEVGTKILVTGDVKDPARLPKCDVLLTEASYGDPGDMGCYFKDDINGLHQVLLSHVGAKKVAFGAYEFGKSQKAVSLIREMGYTGPIAMNEKTLALTESFLKNAGELRQIQETDGEFAIMKYTASYQKSETVISKAESGTQIKTQYVSEKIEMETRIEKKVQGAGEQTEESRPAGIQTEKLETCGCDIFIVPMHHLAGLGPNIRKYVLTCRTDAPFENIRLSDHLDVDGLTQMVKQIDPKITVIYHPNDSPRTDRFAQHLEKNGFKAYSISQIKNIMAK